MTPVFWTSLRGPEIARRGYDDQGWLEAVLARRLGRVPAGVHWVHHEVTPDPKTWPEGEGGVVVVPGRHHAGMEAAVADCISRLGWVLLIITGDEEQVFDIAAVHHPNVRRWVQTPRDFAGVRAVGDWWRASTPLTLRAIGSLDSPGLQWSFAGQVNNRTREELERACKRMRGGRFVSTPGFRQGLDHAAYLSQLVDTKVAPCPSGNFTPDTFRFFESLEAGCVPIVESRSAVWGPSDYWEQLLGDSPVPVTSSWRALGSRVSSLTAEWPRVANRVGAWFSGHRGGLGSDLTRDLAELGARWTPTPADEITVIMPTSLIGAHPSLEIITETIRSVRESVGDAEVVVTADGPPAGAAEADRHRYEVYLRRLLWASRHEFSPCRVVIHDTNVQQATMTRQALETISTPYVLYVEHDAPLTGEIPWPEILGALSSGQAHSIRFHHETHVLDDHLYLHPDGDSPRDVGGVPLVRTAQWSQRPHVALTSAYRSWLAAHFREGEVTFIEDRLHGVVSSAWRDDGEAGWERWRMWLYRPPGSMLRSRHLDGRHSA